MKQKLDNQQLHGKTIATRRINGLSLDEIEYPSNFTIGKHSHDFPLFYLVQKGFFTQFHDRKTLECGPPTLAFIPQGQMHSANICGEGARCFMIAFKDARVEQFSTHSALNDAMDFKTIAPALIAAKIYRESKLNDKFSSLAIEGLILELVAETSRNYVEISERSRPDWLRRIEEILQDGFSEQLTLIEIARSVDIHPMHLTRVFRQYYQCTIGEYVRKLRIEYACRQITATDAALSEIALKAGFYDQSHFSRSFKQIIGLTPTEFRANLRGR